MKISDPSAVITQKIISEPHPRLSQATYPTVVTVVTVLAITAALIPQIEPVTRTTFISQISSEKPIIRIADSGYFLDKHQPSPLEILRHPLGHAGFEVARKELRDIGEQYLRSSGWGGPCEAMFAQLVQQDPNVLINLIRSDALEPGFLSTAAEFAGQIQDDAQVISALLPLTYHDYPLVREGAIYGLTHLIDHTDVRARLEKMRESDLSPGVRTAVRETLES
jgi:hypothetical protein